MNNRNLVIGAVGLMSLGAFGCGAQGGTAPETTRSSASKVNLLGVGISGATPAARSHAAWYRIGDDKILVLGGYTTYGSTVTDRVELWEAEGAEVAVTVLTNLNSARGGEGDPGGEQPVPHRRRQGW